jgi:hypothetical protein
MKKKLLFIGATLCILILGFFLYLFNTQNNGFKRNWKDPELKLNKTMLFLNNIYFAVRPERAIWLKKRQQPLQLFLTDQTLNALKSVHLNTPPGFNTARHNYYFNRLDTVLTAANEQSEITSVENGETLLFKFPTLKFDDPLLTSPGSVIVRVFKREKDKHFLELTKLDLKKIAITKSYRIPGLKDDLFSADGQLQYDELQKRLYYMYYHKGVYDCLDTNLNVIYKGKTIDTVRNASLKIISQKAYTRDGKPEPKITLDQPGNLVNKYFSVYHKKIYLLSGLRADNQSITEFLNNSTIDVYATKNGTYLYSFMLPKFKDLLLRQFHIYDGQLFAIYDKYLVKYDFKD